MSSSGDHPHPPYPAMPCHATCAPATCHKAIIGAARRQYQSIGTVILRLRCNDRTRSPAEPRSLGGFTKGKITRQIGENEADLGRA